VDYLDGQQSPRLFQGKQNYSEKPLLLLMRIYSSRPCAYLSLTSKFNVLAETQLRQYRRLYFYTMCDLSGTFVSVRAHFRCCDYIHGTTKDNWDMA